MTKQEIAKKKAKKYTLIREYYGLTCEDLSRGIGCTKQTISNFENGTRPTSYVKQFYNHKFLKSLYKRIYGIDFCTPIDYIEYILDNLDEDEMKYFETYFDTDKESSYPKFLNSLYGVMAQDLLEEE